MRHPSKKRKNKKSKRAAKRKKSRVKQTIESLMRAPEKPGTIAGWDSDRAKRNSDVIQKMTPLQKKKYELALQKELNQLDDTKNGKTILDLQEISINYALAE